MALTKGAWAVNTIQSLANRVTGQAAALKTNFDKAGSDIKTYVNDTLTVEIDALDSQNAKLTGNQTIAGIKTFTSSPVVPAPTTDLQASTKKYVDDSLVSAEAYADQVEIDAKAYTDQVAADFELGILVDDGITNAKLGTDIKVGSLAALLTTAKTSVVGAVNELYNSMVTLTGTQELSNKTLVAPLIKSTAGDPTILATGAAADVNLQLSAKGSGLVYVGNTSVRINGTTFEYWNGTGWDTLGTKLTKASNTLQHSFDTERGGSAVTDAMLAKLIPDFSGTVRISFESKDSGATAVELGVCIDVAKTATVMSPSVYGLYAKLVDLPLMSASIPAASLLFISTGNNTASYVTRYCDITVSAGVPIILAATLSATRYFKNIRFYYDFVTSTEEGV